MHSQAQPLTRPRWIQPRPLDLHCPRPCALPAVSPLSCTFKRLPPRGPHLQSGGVQQKQNVSHTWDSCSRAATSKKPSGTGTWVPVTAPTRPTQPPCHRSRRNQGAAPRCSPSPSALSLQAGVRVPDQPVPGSLGTLQYCKPVGARGTPAGLGSPQSFANRM